MNKWIALVLVVIFVAAEYQSGFSPYARKCHAAGGSPNIIATQCWRSTSIVISIPVR